MKPLPKENTESKHDHLTLSIFHRYDDVILVPYVMRYGKLVDVVKHNETILNGKRIPKPTKQDSFKYH